MVQSYYPQAKALNVDNKPKDSFRKALRVAVNVLILIGITAVALLACFWTAGNALVSEEIFPSGTTVNGYNIGGLPYEEGVNLVFSELEGELDNYTISLEHKGFSFSLSAEELGIIDGIENMLYNSTYPALKGEAPRGVYAITSPIKGRSLDLTPVLNKGLVQDTLQSALAGNIPEEYEAEASPDSQLITGTTPVDDGTGAHRVYVTVNTEVLSEVASEIVEREQALFDEHVEEKYDTEKMTQYRDIIEKYSTQYGVDPAYVAAVVFVESSHDSKIESSAGAIGLMQIVPSTGQWIADNMGLSHFEADMLFDPETNIKLGCWFISYLIDLFDGNVQNATIAYNAGPTSVFNWLADSRYSSDGKNIDTIPYEETKSYVDQIDSYYDIYKSIYRVN